MDDDFSTLFDFLPIGAYRSSPDGRQLRSNRALWTLNGYASEAEHVAGVRDIASEWYVEPTRREQFKALLERDGFVRDFVSEVHRHKTRERIWIAENAHVVRGAEGSVLHYEGTVEDISARVRAEQAQRESEARWKLALDSTGDGVWDWDLQTGGEVFSANFLALYGFGPDEVDAHHDTFDARTHPHDLPQMQRDREDHFCGRTTRYVNEHRVQCKDGSWKWVLSRGLVIGRDADGRPLRMIGTHTDITSRKQGEALRAQRDRAEAADRAKSELLSRVSHELRTPLNAVLGFAQLLEAAPELAQRHRVWVGHVLDGGRHLLAMVEDLLDVASAEAGALTSTLVAVDAAQVLAESWSMLTTQADAAGVRLDSRALEREAAWTVRADPKRLKQVFANLLSNAVKYNRRGGLVLIGARRDSAGPVQIDIADQGPGLDEGQLSRIFRPFERLGAERAGVAGTGLGLALSRQLLLAMDGEIRVFSTPGQGCTFTVVLPAG